MVTSCLVACIARKFNTIFLSNRKMGGGGLKRYISVWHKFYLRGPESSGKYNLSWVSKEKLAILLCPPFLFHTSAADNDTDTSPSLQTLRVHHWVSTSRGGEAVNCGGYRWEGLLVLTSPTISSHHIKLDMKTKKCDDSNPKFVHIPSKGSQLLYVKTRQQLLTCLGLARGPLLVRVSFERSRSRSLWFWRKY